MSLCFNLQMAGSLLSFFSCGCSIRNMYDGWTPENFIERLSGNAKLNAEQRAAFAMLAAISLYPERSETLDKYVSKKRSAAADLIIPCLKDVSPAIMENFLRMMSEGKTSALSLSKKSVGALAGILVETMETNPCVAVEFVKKRVGKNIEAWVNDGVEGAATLVSRLVPYMEKQAGKIGGMGIEFF